MEMSPEGGDASRRDLRASMRRFERDAASAHGALSCVCRTNGEVAPVRRGSHVLPARCRRHAHTPAPTEAEEMLQLAGDGGL